jgi:signal transduction histidine kinase
VSTLDEPRLRRLIDAGRSVVAERELDLVFDRLLGVARDLTGARYAALGVLDDARKGLSDFIVRGIDEQGRHAIGELPRGRGVLGLLIANPAPLRIPDVGGHASSYGFPPGHPPMRSFLGVPILIRGEAWGNLYLTEKKEGEFDAEDEESAVVLAAWASIAIENARLHRTNEQRRLELERSLHALRATTEIAQAVGGETDLARVLELIAKRSRALVEARGLAILLQDGAGLRVAAMAGDLPAEVSGARVRTGGSIAGAVLAAGRAQRVHDLSSSLPFALADFGVEATAGLFVPLRFRGANVGVLEAFDRIDGPEFRLEDESLLAAAAASAATAVATAQTVERERMRRSLQTAEEERRRWARELHDDTLQSLGGLRVLLSSARRSADTDAIQGALDQALDQLTTEIANLRALITELRPAALDELGLGPALDALFERTRAIHGLEVVARISLPTRGESGQSALTPELETVVYRVLQESLTNAARHARAESVSVEVFEQEGQLYLKVRDDGQGFAASDPTEGFGLTGMRERVALVGGGLEVSSSSAGTTIEVVVRLVDQVRQTA